MSSLVLLLALVACDRGYSDPSRELAPAAPAGEPQAITIRKPPAVGVWKAPLSDDPDRDPDLPESATCGTCHGPEPELEIVVEPGEPFHTNIEVEHGTLTCDHCHDKDRTLLREANGTKHDFSEVAQLCAQCHGPTAKAYENGAHGGMNGYWDLSQGPRTKNNCVDCHPAHAPDFGQVMPVHPPRDRHMGNH